MRTLEMFEALGPNAQAMIIALFEVSKKSLANLVADTVEAQYQTMIENSDVIAARDWRASWPELEDRFQSTIDCLIEEYESLSE